MMETDTSVTFILKTNNSNGFFYSFFVFPFFPTILRTSCAMRKPGVTNGDKYGKGVLLWARQGKARSSPYFFSNIWFVDHPSPL